MQRFPICELCASTTTLCSGCNAKLAEGKISELDVCVSRILLNSEDRFSVGKASFERCFDLGRMALILTSLEVSPLVGKGGRVAQMLSRQLGKHVRVVRSSSDARLMLEEILLPIKPLGVNTVFSAKGSRFKVRIALKDAGRLPTDRESIGKVVRLLFGDSATLVFE